MSLFLADWITTVYVSGTSPISTNKKYISNCQGHGISCYYHVACNHRTTFSLSFILWYIRIYVIVYIYNGTWSLLMTGQSLASNGYICINSIISFQKSIRITLQLFHENSLNSEWLHTFAKNILVFFRKRIPDSSRIWYVPSLCSVLTLYFRLVFGPSILLVSLRFSPPFFAGKLIT